MPDIEAHALTIIAANLGPEQFEQAYQTWLNHWKANEAYSSQVEAQDDRPHGRGPRAGLQGAG
jgi:hypothetical protein